MNKNLLISCWKKFRGGYNLTASEAFAYIRDYVNSGKHQNYQDAIIQAVCEDEFCLRNDC